jgi:hypothetical protein
MAFEGDVATFPVGDLLAWLAQRRATGVLSLTRRLTARRFHLRTGQVRMVSSSEQEMLLGQLLVERALLGPDALAQTLASRGRSRARLGRLLTRGGLVTPAQLQAILAEKTRRLLADAMTWEDGRFFYEAADEAAGDTVRRRARSEDQRAVAVVVDLAAALEEIRREAAERRAAETSADAEAHADSNGYLDIDEGDVVEAMLTSEAARDGAADDPPDDDPGQVH